LKGLRKSEAFFYCRPPPRELPQKLLLTLRSARRSIAGKPAAKTSPSVGEPIAHLRSKTIRSGCERMAVKTKTKAAKNGRADDVIIPDKLYFRIGDVAKLCKLPAYVLRFWETEFPQLAPKKSSAGQRLYRQRDVENVLRIKKLLYADGFTIAGARQYLKSDLKPAKSQAALPFYTPKEKRNELKYVRAGLQEILGILKPRR